MARLVWSQRQAGGGRHGDAGICDCRVPTAIAGSYGNGLIMKMCDRKPSFYTTAIEICDRSPINGLPSCDRRVIGEALSMRYAAIADHMRFQLQTEKMRS